MKIYLTIPILLLSSLLSAEPLIHIQSSVWDSLTPEEKRQISNDYTVSKVDDQRFGKVISSHIQNNSYINNNSMSNLGSVLSQASYIDDNWDDYSAKDQLAFGILGALAGSALDKKTEINMLVTYTLEFPDGSVEDFKRNQKTSHIYGSGVCIDTRDFSSANSNYCNIDKIKEILYKDRNQIVENLVPEEENSKIIREGSAIQSQENIVRCKLGNGAPFTTVKTTCIKVKGTIL